MKHHALLPILATTALSGCALLAHDEPSSHRSPSAPAAMVIFGGSTSDVVQHDSLLHQFEVAVAPTLTEQRADVVVAIAGDRTSTAPEIAVQASYSRAVADAQGNSLVEQENAAGVTTTLLDGTRAAVAAYLPSTTSDPVSGLALATQVHAQFGAQAPFTLYLMGDAISTTPSCNLLLLDLSTAEARTQAIGSCTTGLLIDLAGVEVVIAGAGVDPDDVLSPERAAYIEQFWRELVEAEGGVIRVYAAELVEVAR